jgi:hypothetical protein
LPRRCFTARFGRFTPEARQTIFATKYCAEVRFGTLFAIVRGEERKRAERPKIWQFEKYCLSCDKKTNQSWHKTSLLTLKNNCLSI